MTASITCPAPSGFELRGDLAKMRARLDANSRVEYQLPVGADTLDLAPLLGSTLRLRHSGVIHCIACGRTTRKSFSQGYCFPCVQRLPECDLCIVSPEKCHLAQGTCRDPQWAAGHCLQDHVVYLSNTSGLKVGITRATQVPTRWIDQGATQALPILRVATRHHSGLIEALLKEHVADRTDWRRMLKGEPEPIDLVAARDRLLADAAEGLAQLRTDGVVMTPCTAAAVALDYPVHQYPQKLTSLGFDKTPLVEGTLQGIKGQYLLFDTGVLNVRKFAGYEVDVSA